MCPSQVFHNRPAQGWPGGISVMTPLTLGSHGYDSCRGGVEGHRPRLWRVVVSLSGKEEGNDDRCLRTAWGARLPASATFPRSLRWAPAPTGAPAAPGRALEDRGDQVSHVETQVCSPTPWGAFPKDSVAVQVPQKRWDFQKSRICFENQDPLQMPTATEVVECVH